MKVKNEDEGIINYIKDIFIFSLKKKNKDIIIKFKKNIIKIFLYDYIINSINKLII